MPKLIKMPKLSDTMTEGTLVKWHIKEGDAVDMGKIIADVETDKATMEMQSFETGTIAKLVVKEGGKVALGAPMAVVLAAGEAAPADLDAFIAANSEAAPAKTEAPAAKSAETTAAPAKKGAFAGTLPPTGPAPKKRAAAAANGVRVKASPLARKVAEERGVDLTKLQGTGPGGRIVRADVESAPVGGTASGGSAPAKAVPSIRPVAGPDDQRIPLTGMRNIIAERLLASKTQIPHFYLQIEVDAAPLMAFRKHINDAAEKTGGVKFTVNDFILKAVIRSAVAVPAVNASFDGDAIVQFKHVNLSVAIAIPEGLVTPVIREAETKTLQEISAAVKDLATRAKNKKLSPDEFQGGTLTVSNLGSYGIDQFSAIINPPQAMILSVGSIRNVPVVNDKGAIVAGQRMWLGLSGDHRVVDGAVGATFLQEMRKLVENPALMVV
ncbi:pyruvate dehydrogenase E2 component (dihydrolipoamide acetyltransferase) [Roseimicrobium gellanilyticum]|uniref:Acetyltransferase component of pyruvate dehydrogenase complex n=1 Tax=Roseimicrobium gellanilyticum TaxID=748857 RepID=A0A366HS59_9BACT|nr:pyruvate dehydrogenase complex dihydrolipoamide acetyltransferase [Roseimicrobium gellanilyticum]RBP46512.1 pyruvate dehydrogenase E2 component (dihydrolipoamide acetyltransferase) [Roseimicrobium gellanilyticum]